MNDDPGKNFYDLLSGLVDRTPWKDESEVRLYHDLLAKLRAVNVFGYMASSLTAGGKE